jgi:hypothetical protein
MVQGESKYKILVWTVVLLAVFNVTTLITIFYNRHLSMQSQPMPSSGPVLSEGASMKFSGRYFRDHLGLNTEQMRRFGQFNPTFRRQVQKINFDLADKRFHMLIEMSSPKYDTVRLNQLSDSMGYLHARLKRLTYGYYLNFKEICDMQQQEKLKQLFSEMFVCEKQQGLRHQGSKNGRQHGRRMKQYNN